MSKLFEANGTLASPSPPQELATAVRAPARVVSSGYSHGGASYAKKSMIGWRSTTTDADEDIVENIETLRARSRHAVHDGSYRDGCAEDNSHERCW